MKHPYLILATSFAGALLGLSPALSLAQSCPAKPIAYVASSPNIVVVPTTLPVKTRREPIDYARKIRVSLITPQAATAPSCI